MKAYICDVCHATQEPKAGYEWPPDGWYQIFAKCGRPTQHVCSTGCLKLFADEEQSAEIARLAPAPTASEVVRG